METQFKRIKRSDQLRDYITNYQLLHFEKHGYDDLALEYSRRTVEQQDINAFDANNNKEILCTTLIGQPFLFWNEQNELDIGGVIDYDSKKQTGTFYFTTATGELKVNNVHSYFLFFMYKMKNGTKKYLPISSRNVPSIDELDDVFVSVIVRESNGSFSLILYHNTTIVYKDMEVYPELYYEYFEPTKYQYRKSYFRYSKAKDNNNYENYVYDISTSTLSCMDSSHGMPSFYIDYYSVNSEFDRKYRKLIDGLEAKLRTREKISIIFHLDESKTAYIIRESLKNADEYLIIPNLFSDDDTENIMVTYYNNPEQVRFLYYCFSLREDLLGGAISGIGVAEYLQGTLNYKNEYKFIIDNTPETVSYFKQTVREMFERCKEKIAINRLPERVYSSYPEHYRILNILHEYCYKYDNYWCPQELAREHKLPFQRFIMKNKSKIFQREKVKYDDIFQQLEKNSLISSRWKNEEKLFRLILKEYPDAIYQYHSTWLGRQSLDIYVPSQRLGFEYQGLQHYQPVEFFGGEDVFLKNQERDARKRQLCVEHGVKLIEWRYDFPITIKSLHQIL